MLKNIFNRCSGFISSVPLLNVLFNRDIQHINYHGDPIHKPLHKTFWRSAHFKTTLATTALATAFNHFTNGDINTSLYIPIALLQFLNAEVFFRYKHGYKTYKNLPKDCCIDKRGRLAILNQENWENKNEIENILQEHGAWIAAGILTYILLKSGSKGNVPNSPLRDFIFFTACSNVVVQEISAFYRFLKVLTGEWAIKKIPPVQQKQEQKETLPGGVFEPV